LSVHCQNDTVYLGFSRNSLEGVVLDLNRLDYLEASKKNDSIKIAIFAKQLSYKDSIIYKQDLQLNLYDSVQVEYLSQQQSYIATQKKLQRKNVAVKAQRNVISLSGIVAIILLLI